MKNTPRMLHKMLGILNQLKLCSKVCYNILLNFFLNYLKSLRVYLTK